ncbi:MAG: TolC family protein, partial [Opitutae bacterium]|nr:TolC family protein [Opitutae bacterium]
STPIVENSPVPTTNPAVPPTNPATTNPASATNPISTTNPAVPDTEKKRDGRKLNIRPVSDKEIDEIVGVTGKISLREAIPQALRKNLGIAISRVEHASMEETPEIAEAEFDPTLSFSSQYNNDGNAYWRHDRVAGSSSHDWANEIALSKKFSYGTEASIYGDFNRTYNTTAPYSPASGAAVGVEITQPLLSGFGEEVNLAPLVLARQNVLQSKLSLRKSTLDLLYDVEVAYQNLAAAFALVHARLSSLRHAEFVLEQAKKLRALNSATREDVLQAEADVASNKVNLVSARQSVQDYDDELRKLLGQTGETQTGVYRVAPLRDDIPAETISFAEWIRQVRDFDIDSQIQEIEREKAELNYKVALDADKPSLDLVLGAEFSGADKSPGYAVTGIVDRPGYNAGVGIKFSMPIGFRQARAELRQAEQARTNAALSIAQALQEAMFDARSAWRACESAHERLDAAKTALAMQNESYESQVAKYSRGSATMTDVLSAQNSLDSARLEVIQAALDVATASARIHRLDGRILSENGFTWTEVDYGEGPATTTNESATTNS